MRKCFQNICCVICGGVAILLLVGIGYITDSHEDYRYPEPKDPYKYAYPGTPEWDKREVRLREQMMAKAAELEARAEEQMMAKVAEEEARAKAAELEARARAVRARKPKNPYPAIPEGLVGMSKEQVLARFGQPKRIITVFDEEWWIYGNDGTGFYFKNGIGKSQ